MTDRQIYDRSRSASFLFRRWVWGYVFLIIGAVGCVGEELPADLIGTWMATSPRYQGRFLEISKEHVIFGADEGHSTYYTIRGVESEELENETLYTIEYHGVGGTGRTLSLRFSEGDPVAIELENQDGIWIRKDRITPKRKESL